MSAAKSSAPATDPGLLAQWRENRFGFVGLVLTAVQLLLHLMWIGLTEYMAAQGNLKEVSLGTWQAWLIVLLVLVSGMTTMLSLFLSLYGSIHGRPRTPALIGLAVSFFCGALITFVLLLTALTGAQ